MVELLLVCASQVVPAAKPFVAPGGAGLLPLLAKALPFDRLPSMFATEVRRIPMGTLLR